MSDQSQPPKKRSRKTPPVPAALRPSVQEVLRAQVSLLMCLSAVAERSKELMLLVDAACLQEDSKDEELM